MYKITYISDARIPSEMANSVSILNLCSTFSELGNEVNLLKRWRYQNRNVNIDDVFDMYGLQTKFNIVDIPNLDLSVLDFFTLALDFLTSLTSVVDFFKFNLSIHSLISSFESSGI